MRKCFFQVLISILFIGLLFASVGQVAPTGNGNAPGRKIVVFMGQVAPAAQDAMIQRAGAGKIKNLPLINAAVVMATPAAEKALARSNGVLRIEDDAVATILGQLDNAGKVGGKNPPPPPPQVLPWGVDRIDAEQVWAPNTGTGSTGSGVKVAVVDTGIDLAHPDLAVAGGYNAINSHKTANDDNGHGSHVAGIIAAKNNTLGVVGVAPDAELYAVKVLGSNGIGWVSDIIEGIQWCIDHDIQVINMSLSSSSNLQAFEDAVSRAADSGIIIVAAAGNEGGAVGYPAAYDSVIAVSATDDSNTIASWSNRGSEIDLAAPGVSIYSTYKGGGYATMSGTSMASPHVAGVAALILELSGSDGVRNILQSTADNLGEPDRDDLYGDGLVDADGAVAVAAQ